MHFTAHRGRKAPLLRRLSQTRRILHDAHASLSASAAGNGDVGPAGEWLLDNFHVIQEHIREVQEALPRGYYRELPELTSGRLAGYPRVYELAIALISHSEARIDRDNLAVFVSAYQSGTSLSIGELWALPAMFRIALVESVRRMTLRTLLRMADIDRADAWAARLDAAREQGEIPLAGALDEFLASPPALTEEFVTRFLHQLRLMPGSHQPLVDVEAWITERAMSNEVASARATQHLALTQVMMANSITSLRTIGQLDWRTFVEQQSALEAILRTDPAGCYSQMTFATRDHYRHVVEQVSRRTDRSEEDVARMAIALAASACRERGSQDAHSHVGYYLVDDGRTAFEAAAGYRPRPRDALRRWVLRHADATFTTTVIAGAAAALAAMVWLAGADARTAWVPLVLLAIIPASHIAITLADQLVTTLLSPRTLPRLDLSGREGIPAHLRTAVVMPTLFGSVASVEEAFDHLEVQFLANRGSHLHFAVLSDFTDADEQSSAGDEAILTAALARVTDLNTRHAPQTGDAFFLFHRPRRWNACQSAWMGWERKRGKLTEFNRFLCTASADAFSTIAGNVTTLREVRYVITLDADTVLPPGGAAELIGTLAHPLNRAVYDRAAGRVVRGYGILQPRVAVSLPSAHRSRFSSIHSGHPGVDPYTTATSDVYQDLFGEGSFTGKGIYDVEVFEQATHGRFPENRLLSHDLIEGSYARAGLVTGTVVYDDYPAHYLSFTRRKHRWIRGDWQLIRWLTTRVPGPGGPEVNRLPLLSRWKIFDNLRRSILEIGLALFLAAGWLVLPGRPLAWTALMLLSLAAPWIVSMLRAVLRPPLDRSWRAYYASVLRDARTAAQQVALAVTFLPHQAWVSADAIVRTLWRLAVTRRNLLEWQTASSTEKDMLTGRAYVWRTMSPAALIAVGTAALAILRATGAGSAPWSADVLAIACLGLVWAASPAIAHSLSAPPGRRQRPLEAALRTTARDLALLHWHYFDQFVTESTHGLVPDNVQEAPGAAVAMRTSPTNIGMQLLAIGSAHDLGFITTDDMTDRLEAVFRALERMKRYRGHFFNWYDLNDLEVLEPAYISTVDSGNLAGHLLALRQACLDAHGAAIDTDSAALRGRLVAIADRAGEYVDQMDFSFLYDEDRELFSIGYQCEARTLDPSYYDLLASEARLASFVAIAKADVPVEHWFQLGRSLTHASGATALVSWSGSMFEYLMPVLVMRAYPGTLLDQTYRAAVHRQIADGSRRNTPWGVSESAYNLRDHQLTYQYRAFGVPDLGLKRGLGREHVVAPYASALALLVEPEHALENLAGIARMDALGPWGFRDAIDYTRPDPGSDYAIVGNYMAHHIGMSLAALTNVLTDNVWQQRFHADPLVRSAELLLHERIPHRLLVHPAAPAGADGETSQPEEVKQVVREFTDPNTPRPHVALLGREPYTVMVTHAGSGFSRYQDVAVTRWRADGTADAMGQFCYVRDVTSDRVWSAAYQPVCAPADRYRALLGGDRVTFERSDGGIETRTDITVVPDDGAEVRSVTVTNRASATREVELTSYGEIVLGPADADRAHPAFANLFVETEWHEWCTALTATRRPRSASEPSLWCVHVIDAGSGRVGPVSYETDRARFIGRGRTARAPAALDSAGPLSGTTGAVLDPVFALRTRLRLLPGESATVTFTTLVSPTRDGAFELADRYHASHTAQRALDLAWTTQQVELRDRNLSPADAALFQTLAGCLLYPHPALRASQEDVLRNRGAQPVLWSTGLSGDRRIVLASIDGIDGLPTLRHIAAAHHFWRRRGLLIDLVILSTQPASYLKELQDRIMETLFSIGDAALERPGGVFLRNAEALDADTLLMLRATARLILPCDGRSLAHLEDVLQAEAPADGHAPSQALQKSGIIPGAPAETTHPADLMFHNGLGGLDASGDYVIRVAGDALPPAPWANVIAHERGGFIVSERGAGCTWSDSSYFFRLSPWHNDPVSDPISDVLYLQDEQSGATWSATPAPVGNGAHYTVRHGAGTSVFETEQNRIATSLTLTMAEDEPVRLSMLRITNTDVVARRIRLSAYVEWTLGTQRERTQYHVRTTFDGAAGALFARNTFDPLFHGHVAFCALSEPVTGHTADRREFLGRNGTVSSPAGLLHELSGTTGPGLDPCAALQCVVELAPGESREIVLSLGAAAGEAEARRLVALFRDVPTATASADRVIEEWRHRLSGITVRTPEPAFDALLNRWLPYQTLACRMWARSAVYQSSGAYGFRDQLQDALALIYAEPAIARGHIVRAAARQFREGDVQHWWHPHTGSGVRTRFSDDLAWLPWVAAEYILRTGDSSVLDEYVPFLDMRPLAPGEDEIYDRPGVTDEHASVYEHCLRALRTACTTGAHGLPLIGTGDWNDGMSRVGVEGRGESVWLAWFLITTLRAFAVHATERGDDEAATEMRARADAYVVAVETHAWDGDWYVRAFFDDGTPLGSSRSDECMIDAIAQSWSVISGAGAPDRQARAMQSLEEHLVDEDVRLIRLLTPPFDRSAHDPGYIKGYLPGVRENGAQYTHAAAWAILATARSGPPGRAFDMFQMINPLLRTRTPDEVATYKVEPYVIAADVYTADGHVGRGGWTWYTGAAGWMYRVGLEEILGFTLRGSTLRIEPRVPIDWPELIIEYRFGTARYMIVVHEPGRLAGGAVVTVDGHELSGTEIPLTDDGAAHRVQIRARPA